MEPFAFSQQYTVGFRTATVLNDLNPAGSRGIAAGSRGIGDTAVLQLLDIAEVLDD